MRIAVASGKGGTGKTTVATNLAFVAAAAGRAVAYLDADVEEPNGHVFLQPMITTVRPIVKPVPEIDAERCRHCGQCGRICQYGAIACLPRQTLVFAELCHACGGCELVCPNGAIRETARTIGQLRLGQSGAVRFAEGVLNVGEAMSPPAIRALKSAAPEADLTLLDCPPGTSCPVVESVRGADLVLLVTEPTPFGLNDLKLAVEMVRAMKLPVAIVLNRCDVGDDRVHQYCNSQRIAIVAEIADDRAVGEAYSRGELVSKHNKPFRDAIARLLESLACQWTH